MLQGTNILNAANKSAQVRSLGTRRQGAQRKSDPSGPRLQGAQGSSQLLKHGRPIGFRVRDNTNSTFAALWFCQLGARRAKRMFLSAWSASGDVRVCIV
jgi:hypothetical protein